MMFLMVDLPAPFSPANPTTSPVETVNETPSTAVMPPNDFDTSLTAIAGAGRTTVSPPSRGTRPDRDAGAAGDDGRTRCRRRALDVVQTSMPPAQSRSCGVAK